jgi:hypothetical protein
MPGGPVVRPVISPVKLPQAKSPMEAFRYDAGYQQLVESIKTGKIRPRLEELDVKRSFPFVSPGVGAGIWGAMQNGGLKRGDDIHAPVIPVETCSVVETYQQLLDLQAYVLEAHTAYGLGDNGPMGPDEDDPHGDIQFLGMIAYVSDVLGRNEGLLRLSVHFADRPVPNVPHPADLQAVILAQQLIDRMLGRHRTPALRAPARMRSIDAPEWKLGIARNRARQSPLQFDMVTQPDLHTLLVRMGWDGADHRSEASYVPGRR